MSDLIDRQAALDAVNAYLGLSAVSRTIQNMMSIQEILENLPSAEPEHLVKESGDLVKDLVNDCISRQDAIDALTEYGNGRAVFISVGEAVIRIEQLPSAQPEIIRCKDCKHRDPEDKKCDCGHDIEWQLPRQDDWFCADAER